LNYLFNFNVSKYAKKLYQQLEIQGQIASQLYTIKLFVCCNKNNKLYELDKKILENINYNR